MNGYWTSFGKAASIDWCEPNYTHSPYVAEWWNTWSSLWLVVMGLYGLGWCWRERAVIEPRFFVCFLMMVFVGAGSAGFHGTMLEVAQALIEYGRRSEALEWIERAERLRSQAQVAQVKANLLLELGEEARAADAFERFIRQQAVVGTSRRGALNGRQRQALTRAVAQVVQTYEGRGAYGAGARLVRRLRDGLGTDVNLVAQEACLLIRAGRLDEGLELLRDLRFGADDPSPMLGVWGGLRDLMRLSFRFG